MKRPTVMITGSSKGLGRSLALSFANDGYDVIIHGRNEKRLEEVKIAVMKSGVNCMSVLGDITSAKTIAMLYTKALAIGLDILINNVAIYDAKPLGLMIAEVIDRVIDVNLVAPIILTNRVLSIFIGKKKGLIININSIAGKQFSGREAIYCASKHGLRGFSNSIREEASRHNVGVLDIYLGAMRTDMVKDRPGSDKFIDPTEAAVAILHLVENFETLKIKEAEIGRAIY